MSVKFRIKEEVRRSGNSYFYVEIKSNILWKPYGRYPVRDSKLEIVEFGSKIDAEDCIRYLKSINDNSHVKEVKYHEV